MEIVETIRYIDMSACCCSIHSSIHGCTMVGPALESQSNSVIMTEWLSRLATVDLCVQL